MDRVLGNAFRCDQSCYWVDQELRKKKTIQQISWRKIWETVNLKYTLPCAITGTPVGVLYCSVNDTVASQVCHGKCKVESNKCAVCLLTWAVRSTSAPLDSWNMSYFPEMFRLASRLSLLSFFSSTSQPPGKSVCGSEMGCEWSPQQTLDRPCIPPIDILPTFFPTSISTVTFSHPLHHFSAWLAFHLWICMAG